MAEKSITFSAGVRGFQVYKSSWKPEDGEVLKSEHEKNNPYDIFSMKVFKPNSGEIVGHLPMEISRITKFIEDRGANVSLKIRGRHYSCLLYTSPSPRDGLLSRMPSSA